MVTSGAGRTLSQAGSNVLLMYSATSPDENSTVLARRAFVQQNCRSSCPIMWNIRTGLPDFWAAAWASATVGCHLTRPGATFGFSTSEGSGATCGVGASATATSTAATGAGPDVSRCVPVASAVERPTSPAVSQSSERSTVGNIRHLVSDASDESEAGQV